MLCKAITFSPGLFLLLSAYGAPLKAFIHVRDDQRGCTMIDVVMVDAVMIDTDAR